MSARAAGAAVAAVALLGLVLVGLAALADRREVAFATGLPAVLPAAELAPGRRACRGGVDAPAAFAGIRLVTGSFGRPGPPLDVVVDGPSGSRRARVAGGYPDNAAVQARFAAVPPGRVRVCVRNAGAARVVLFGAPPQTAYDEVRTTDRPAALGVVFLAAEPRSMAAMVPEVVRRAARFKPAWLGAWAYWVLLVAVALGLPALLAAAASSSSRSASS